MRLIETRNPITNIIENNASRNGTLVGNAGGMIPTGIRIAAQTTISTSAASTVARIMVVISEAPAKGQY